MYILNKWKTKAHWLSASDGFLFCAVILDFSLPLESLGNFTKKMLTSQDTDVICLMGGLGREFF